MILENWFSKAQTEIAAMLTTFNLKQLFFQMAPARELDTGQGLTWDSGM